MNSPCDCRFRTYSAILRDSISENACGPAKVFEQGLSEAPTAEKSRYFIICHYVSIDWFRDCILVSAFFFAFMAIVHKTRPFLGYCFVYHYFYHVLSKPRNDHIVKSKAM